MRKIILFVLVLTASVRLSLAQEGTPFTVNGNPIVRDIYTADPSARVWADGRLYVYPSHDNYPSRGCDLMDKYHVYSTEDMVNWIDHGQILERTDVPWAENLADDGKFMWAPDCVYKDGIYYFYFPTPVRDPWGDTWQIGIATSDKPASGFVVLDEPLKGIPSHGQIDPNIFIDDDGQAYFYYGGGGTCYGAKLKDNMIELDGPLEKMMDKPAAGMPVTNTLKYFHEGAWVFKKNGLYYLTYPGNHSGLINYVAGQDQLLYATSTSPLGPWEYRGSYLRPTGCDTSHGSVLEYKGQWYAFYHNIALSGNGTLRSICVDKLYFQEDGIRLQVVKQTRDCGSPYGGTPWPVAGIIEAEDFNEGGESFGYSDKSKGNSGGYYRKKENVDIEKNRNGEGIIIDTQTGEFLNYTIDVQETGLYSFDFIASSASTALSAFHLELDGDKIVDKTEVPYGTKTSFGTATIEDIALTKGTHILTVYLYGGLYIDKYVFRQQGTSIELPAAHAFSVYPNPSDGIFQLNIPQAGALSVTDISGRQVYSEKAVQSGSTLNLTHEPAGIYLVSLRTNDRIHRLKLVKK